MNTVEIPVHDILDTEIYVKVSCNFCQRPLEASWWHGELVVDPCEYCRNESYEEGLDEGRNE